MKQPKSAVVLANGTFPNNDITLEILNGASFLVCCDGAANNISQHNITPNIIIGDGDSLAGQLKELYKDIIISVEDQETNDLTKAVLYLIEQEYTHITILGGTGKREDHTIGNIGLLMDYLDLCNIKMVTEYGVFYPCNKDFQYKGKIGQQLSIYNFGYSQIEADGLVYPVRAFQKWWEGTLNEICSEEVTIRTDGKFLVFITHDVK